nr:PREDICTED: Golgi apparatus protein 1 [Bemisia tabaci]
MILQWVIFIHLALLCYTASTVNPQNNNANALSVFNGDSRALIINRNINKEHKVPLRDERECSHELKHLCPVEEYESDDLSILTCIQYLKTSEISQSCQHVVWQHTIDIVSDDSLSKIIRPFCKEEISCKQDVFRCIIEHLPEIKSKPCMRIIHQIELIGFSDFKVISMFTQDCQNDIEKYHCGCLPGDRTKATFSQGKTLACLQEHLTLLENKCRKQVLQLSELQSDDVAFDRVLDKACADLKARFCKNVQSPEEVYSCLIRHRNDDYIKQECRDQLIRREKLISQDFQVSKGLSRACKEYIKMYRCRRWLSDDKEIRLAQILVCLENAIHNETSQISPECIREMKDHRQMLLDDYKLSPEIVSQCSNDITNFCQGLRSKTIQCLMEHSHPNRVLGRVSFPCQKQLETLVLTSDVGEDWRVDPVLHEACQSVVNKFCPEIKGGNARVMSCLMDKLKTYKMTKKCESALLQIQYFVARNFRLDPPLYRACRMDAHKLCHAKVEWATPNEAYSPKGQYVLPCLYRYLRNKEVSKLKPACKEEVQRVMRQRALYVELNPEIEQVCLDDLALMCSEKMGKGDEIDCLQQNLDQLKSSCQDVIRNYTEVQMEDVQVNPIILRNCAVFIDKYCQNEINKDVMDCLIRIKNEQSLREQMKCRATIEHYQLISLQEFRFTVAFKNACQSYVSRYCSVAKTKPQIIECLSEIVRNDTLSDVRNKISKNCRQQLRSQLLSQRENIEFNPKLKTSCQMDIKKFCADVPSGSARVLECLKEQKKKLSEKCHHIVFKIEEQDLTDSSTDYTLLSTCKTMINAHCPDMSEALTCLKEVKDQPGFDLNCKMIVVKRIIEQNQDYRFNPVLTKACKVDMVKYCSDLIKSPPADTEVEGKVVKCLKIKFRQRKLRAECEQQLIGILKEAALNYKLNPLLQHLCTDEIKSLCGGKDDDQEGGSVEECLKVALQNGQLVNRACRLEVAGLIEETRVDIHVDPLLHRACASDLNVHCSDTPPGGGRHIQCLLNIIADPVKAESLNRNCHVMLSQRLELFREASNNFIALPQSMGDLYGQVSHSPQKKYFFLMLFSFIGMVFLSGLFFGRASRRSVYSLLVSNPKSNKL